MDDLLRFFCTKTMNEGQVLVVCNKLLLTLIYEVAFALVVGNTLNSSFSVSKSLSHTTRSDLYWVTYNFAALPSDSNPLQNKGGVTCDIYAWDTVE